MSSVLLVHVSVPPALHKYIWHVEQDYIAFMIYFKRYKFSLAHNFILLLIELYASDQGDNTFVFKQQKCYNNHKPFQIS